MVTFIKPSYLWLKKDSTDLWYVGGGHQTFARSLLPSLSPQRNRSKPRLAVHREGAEGWHRDLGALLLFTETTLGCGASASAQAPFSTKPCPNPVQDDQLA